MAGQGTLLITGTNGIRSASIIDPQGRTVRSVAAGKDGIVWDRRNAHGVVVTPGMYVVRLLGRSGATSSCSMMVR
jgi:hypothetical protein